MSQAISGPATTFGNPTNIMTGPQPPARARQLRPASARKRRDG
ncbi:hypothetical protein [Rhizobium sp. P44RR-XXIV]|nr:hypothetical protein [Rhizobium sp. P44RR-XXIV]